MPTILTIIPLLFLYWYIVAPFISPLLAPIWDILPTLTGITINAAFIYLVVLVNRFLSKAIFQHLYYQDDLKMPTTDFLLPGNPSLDNVSRRRYFTLINADFGIDMESGLNELGTEDEKRLMITRIVGQIRQKLRDNKMLLQHNIEYGFFRNLLGGCVLAILLSVALLIISCVRKDTGVFYTSILFLITYSIPVLLSKWLIMRHGHNYATVLFEQYGSMSRI